MISRADVFYYHSPRFGFFLNIGRFHKSFLLQLPAGHPARPSAALINAVYLWGTHLSPALSETYEERAFLRNALHYLSKDLSSSHPHKVLHGIQAEVLLSYYYLKNGKVLEGNYHANAAVSLSLSAGFHRIRTPGTSNILQGHIRSSNSALPYPTDGIEEGERIDAFWAVLILNNYWVAIQESHSMFYDLQNVGIDTPWPMDSMEYEQVRDVYHVLIYVLISPFSISFLERVKERSRIFWKIRASKGCPSQRSTRKRQSFLNRQRYFAHTTGVGSLFYPGNM